MKCSVRYDAQKHHLSPTFELASSDADFHVP